MRSRLTVNDIPRLLLRLDERGRLDNSVQGVAAVDHGPVLARLDELPEEEHVLLGVAGRYREDDSLAADQLGQLRQEEVQQPVGFQVDPAAHCVTSAPAAATSPASSLPRTRLRGRSRPLTKQPMNGLPLRTPQSDRLTVLARNIGELPFLAGGWSLAAVLVEIPQF